MNYIKSQKGHLKLILNNYVFLKDRNANDVVQWKCEKYTNFKCPARVHVKNEQIINNCKEHNNSTDLLKNKADEVIIDIKNQAETTSKTPDQIICAVSNKLDFTVAAKLPPVHLLKRTINRKRKVEETGCLAVSSISELHIPDKYKKTIANENFLIYDNKSDENRILIFSTTKNLKILAETTTWYIDGTFESCPNIFKQVFTIHCIMGGYTVPLVYSLLPSKTYSIYCEMFEAIKNIQANLNPLTIMSDFENSVIKAVKEHFPGAQHKGCFFHFSQAIYRKIQASGLKIKYETDFEFAIKLKLLAALAYVPVDYLQESFKTLLNFVEFPVETETVIDYFEKTWIGRSAELTQRSPVFPHQIWNCFDSVLQNMPRTNNCVEGWHRSFNQMVSRNPSIWKLINVLQAQQSKNELIINQFLSGAATPPKKKKYVTITNKIKKICSRWEANMAPQELMQYLKGIATTFSY